MATRPPLRVLGLNTGKKARLHRILFQHGLRNGTAIFLPYDQGLEHGPRDFFANPKSSDPRYIVRLALEGGFNGIAIQIGLAEKFYWDYRRRGAADPQAQRQDRHPVRRRGALAGPRHRRRCRTARRGRGRLHALRRHAGAGAGLRAVSPGSRGRASARHAADRVGLSARLGDRGQGRQGLLLRRRLRRPHRERTRRRRREGQLPAPGETRLGQAPSTTREFSTQQAIDAVVRSANRTLVLVSGGTRAGDEAMLEKARESMEAGATGLIFGRNVWQREHDESLRLVDRLKQILAKYPTDVGI